MNIKITKLFVTLVLALVASIAIADPAAGLKLAKEYDFRTTTSIQDFNTSYMWPREQIINNEAQFYPNPTKVPAEYNPFRLSDVGLTITAMLTPDELLEYAVNQPYLSGLLTSRDKEYSQLFGYWEMSAKLPSAKGAWPAFWLLPTFKQWPAGIAVLSEIDIMEATQEVINGTYHGSMHTNESGQMVHSKDNDIKTEADLVNEFHRYGVLWGPDYIAWYFDGGEVIKRKTPADMQTEPRHFLLNLAVGGWGGTPDPADYPATFDIEYVRIYESDHKPATPKETDDYPGDVIHVLEDGRVYTSRDAELSAAYLLEVSTIVPRD